MKSIKSIRSSVKNYREPEAYAQYLYRENKPANADTYFEFRSACNGKKKISRPLQVISGGLA